MGNPGLMLWQANASEIDIRSLLSQLHTGSRLTTDVSNTLCRNLRPFDRAFPVGFWLGSAEDPNPHLNYRRAISPKKRCHHQQSVRLLLTQNRSLHQQSVTSRCLSEILHRDSAVFERVESFSAQPH